MGLPVRLVCLASLVLVLLFAAPMSTSAAWRIVQDADAFDPVQVCTDGIRFNFADIRPWAAPSPLPETLTNTLTLSVSNDFRKAVVQYSYVVPYEPIALDTTLDGDEVPNDHEIRLYSGSYETFWSKRLKPGAILYYRFVNSIGTDTLVVEDCTLS